ncbi:14264_t:CDS:2, partial [Racocetra fulgida]
HFINAFAYHEMVTNTNPSLLKSKLLEEGNKKWHEIKKKEYDSIQREIQNLLSTPIPLQATFGFAKNLSMSKIPTSSNQQLILRPSTFSPFHEYEIFPNAAAQKAECKKIKIAKTKIIELESLFNLATDIKNKNIINECSKKIDALKQRANNQARMVAKKQKQLSKEDI